MAVLWAFLGSAAFTVVFSSSWFIGDGVSPVQVLFLRYASGSILAVLIVLIWFRGFKPVISPRPQMHLIRAVIGSSGELCIIAAPLHVSLVDSTSIGLTSAIFALLFAALFLGERTSAMQRLAVVLSFSGALLVAINEVATPDPGNTYLGISLAFAGAILIGAENVYIKLLSSQEKAIAVMLYVNVLAALILGVFALPSWHAMSADMWMETLALGPIALFAQFCWIQALRSGDLSIVAPVGYSSIPVSEVLAFLVLDKLPNLTQFGGSGLVAIPADSITV